MNTCVQYYISKQRTYLKCITLHDGNKNAVCIINEDSRWQNNEKIENRKAKSTDITNKLLNKVNTNRSTNHCLYTRQQHGKTCMKITLGLFYIYSRHYEMSRCPDSHLLTQSFFSTLIYMYHICTPAPEVIKHNHN